MSPYIRRQPLWVRPQLLLTPNRPWVSEE